MATVEVAVGLAVGDEAVVVVGPVAHGGHFVARHQGQVVFVRHALPGEQVRARVSSLGPGGRFVRADAVEVLTTSPHRVVPPCRYAGPGRCGGCDFQHVSLAAQRDLKERVIREQFHRLAGLDVDVRVEPVPGDLQGLRWRTRAEFTATAQGCPAMRVHHSHDLVEIEDCLLATEGVVASGVFAARYAEGTTVDVVSPGVGDPVIIAIPEETPSPIPDVTERVQARWSSGDGTRHELIHDFAVSARGFWQVHQGAATSLVEAALSMLDPRRGDTVLDLFSGAGLFTAALAEAVGERGRVVAVESDPDAAEHARSNLSAYDNVLTLVGRVDDTLGAARARRRGSAPRRPTRIAAPNRHPLLPPRADVVLLDPPRTGAGRNVLQGIVALAPRAIGYVACDPAALARDAATLATSGYAMTRLRAFDAFPMTHHVECIATFTGAAG